MLKSRQKLPHRKITSLSSIFNMSFAHYIIVFMKQIVTVLDNDVHFTFMEIAVSPHSTITSSFVFEDSQNEENLAHCAYTQDLP